MSAAAPLKAAPRPTGSARAQRPHLVVVPKPTAGRIPFVLAVAGVLAIGLVALLLLHTLAAQDAFTLHKLTYRSAALADQEQALTIANEQAQAPSDLALRADGLGMVPAQSLRVTRLHGRPVVLLSAPYVPPPAPVATAKPTPSVKPAATAKPAPKPTASPRPTATPTPTPTPTPTHR